MITDPEGIIRMVNPAFNWITGYSADEVIGKNPRLLQSGHHDKKFYEDMWTTLTEDGEWINEMWNRRKDGGAYLQRLSIKKIEDSKGRTVHFLALFQDITDIRHNDKQLKHQANHDPLTNLPNRQLFKDRLERAIADACRHKEMTAVLYLELVNFKNINTSFGHHFGDIFLKDITVSIKSLFRDQDTVARIGGVEFAIVLPRNTDAHGARVVANKLIELFKKRFIIDNKEFFVGVRIGITIYPTDGESVEPLMKNAVLALSDAKKQDKNSYAMFTSNMDVCALRRVSLAASLFRALDRNEFSVHFQPKVDTQTERTIGAEALARWQTLENGMVPPDEFIPLAEETGVIFTLGEWVLRTACRHAKEWHDRGYKDLTIAVNLSAKQFNDRNLITIVQNVLEETGLAAEFLNLEITENMVIGNVDTAIDIMNRITETGIRISIDDFGTGYSSLNYLKRFPVSELKIDRSFVLDIPENPDDVAITKAIISLAHSLNLKVVAEGVETREQLEFMQRYCCEELQGYYFSKPVPGEDFLNYLKHEDEASGNYHQ